MTITIYRYNEVEGRDGQETYWMAVWVRPDASECDKCHNLISTNTAWSTSDEDGGWLYCEDCVELDDSEWDDSNDS